MKDDELIRKGAVKKVLREAGFKTYLVDAIDALEPFVPQDKPEPDYKAMIEDLETDFNGTYHHQINTKTESLRSILKRVRAKHSPASAGEAKKEQTKGGAV